MFAKRTDTVGTHRGQIGFPGGTVDPEDASLLAAALRRIDGPVYIDLADVKSQLRGFLEASGFAVQRPFIRMLLGRRESFDDGSRTYAVIGPEFG